MPVTARPDVTGAVIAYLRASAAIAALAGTKISARRQASWDLPSYAVLVEGRRGGGEQGPILWQRMDVTCYGPDDRTADLLWRTLDYAFCPEEGSGRANGFRAASTTVLKVAREGGPLGLVDPETAWPYTVATYQVFYAPSPVEA